DDDELDLAGAGDQGMMFGYASNETEELMPLPISLAHKLAQRLAHVRKADVMQYLRPDGKTQVSVRYRDGRPVEIEKLLISTQHKEGAESLIPDDLWEHVVEPILPKDLYDEKKLRRAFLVNPTGRFVIGGPVGDAGLTGRKIIVDTYGGMARHGGGAFSGKDPSKVDRSAAYAARYVAKNLVAAGLADKLEVQVAYAIGVAHPVSVMIEAFGTERIAVSKIRELVEEHFDLRPGAFRRYLDLLRLGDADEGEVRVAAAGRVEVDGAELENALEHALVRVHVLHAVEAGLLHVAGDDPAADVQALVGDRVRGGDALDQPHDDHKC